MSTDFTRYIPLKQVVSYVLDANNLPASDFDKLWVLAFRGLVDMQYEISAEPKTLRLPVQANKTVVLPPDYLGYTKIGLLNNKGEIVTLKVNNALTTLKDTNPNRLEYLTPNVNTSVGVIVQSPLYLNYFYNGYYNNYYGIRGGLIQFGECTVDEKNNVIVLPADFHYDDIMLEYISSPQKDSDYQIQIHEQEAIIAFIEWKLKLGTDRHYYNSLKIARRRKPGKKVVMQEVNQVVRETVGMKLRS